MEKRADGKCCGNCVETASHDFGGACAFAGEVSSNYYCEHWQQAVFCLISLQDIESLELIAGDINSNGGENDQRIILSHVRDRIYSPSPCGSNPGECIILMDKRVKEACLVAMEKENDELLTKLVQELAGTWRMRDAKLFAIIRKYRKTPVGAMKSKGGA